MIVTEAIAQAKETWYAATDTENIFSSIPSLPR